MNEYFSPHNWMNYWMNKNVPYWKEKWINFEQISPRTLFLGEKGCFWAMVVSVALGDYPIFIWMNISFEWIIWDFFEWIFSLNEYFDLVFELNSELNGFLALFNVWMNNQNLSPRAIQAIKL